MSLLLVRHGQARAGTDDYDRLSERGVEQATRLGHWLAGGDQRIDTVLVGAMRRHRQTFDAIAAGMAERGAGPLPAPHVDGSLDEFDHHAVFDGFASAHPTHPAVRGSRDGGLLHLEDNRSTALWQMFAGYHPVRSLFVEAGSGDLAWRGGVPERDASAVGGIDLCGAKRGRSATYGAFDDFSGCLARQGR